MAPDSSKDLLDEIAAQAWLIRCAMKDLKTSDPSTNLEHAKQTLKEAKEAFVSAYDTYLQIKEEDKVNENIIDFNIREMGRKIAANELEIKEYASTLNPIGIKCLCEKDLYKFSILAKFGYRGCLVIENHKDDWIKEAQFLKLHVMTVQNIDAVVLQVPEQMPEPADQPHVPLPEPDIHVAVSRAAVRQPQRYSNVIEEREAAAQARAVQKELWGDTWRASNLSSKD